LSRGMAPRFVRFWQLVLIEAAHWGVGILFGMYCPVHQFADRGSVLHCQDEVAHCPTGFNPSILPLFRMLFLQFQGAIGNKAPNAWKPSQAFAHAPIKLTILIWIAVNPVTDSGGILGDELGPDDNLLFHVACFPFC